MIAGLIEKIFGVNVSLEGVSEIRLRVGFVPLVLVGGEVRSFSLLSNEIGVVTEEHLSEVIKTVTFNAFYTYEHKIARGFLDYYGSKISLCGSGVYKDNQLFSIKDITSINIRIPRFVKGCSQAVFNKLYKNKPVESTLIIGGTCVGKTTLLKDLITSFNGLNIVAIDTRCELCERTTSLGCFVDVLTDIDKETAIEFAIRGLNPHLIAMDELMTCSESKSCLRAKRAGISLLATFHGNSIDDYIKSDLYIKDLFTNFVVLKPNKGKGLIKSIIIGGED